jgi:hypothetical protein
MSKIVFDKLVTRLNVLSNTDTTFTEDHYIQLIEVIKDALKLSYPSNTKQELEILFDKIVLELKPQYDIRGLHFVEKRLGTQHMPLEQKSLTTRRKSAAQFLSQFIDIIEPYIARN